jgi:hypothetical protein
MSLFDLIFWGILIYAIVSGFKRQGAEGDAPPAAPSDAPPPVRELQGEGRTEIPNLAELRREIEERKRERQANPPAVPEVPMAAEDIAPQEEWMQEDPQAMRAEPPAPAPQATAVAVAPMRDYQAELAALTAQVAASQVAARQAGDAYRGAISQHRRERLPIPQIENLLRSSAGLRTGVIISEILSPPKALR